MPSMPRIPPLTICALAAASTMACAQTLFTGELTGTVTDSSGAAIASANVALTSQETGAGDAAASDAAGEFRFPLLRPGAYLLTVSADGFETQNRRTTIQLGQSSNLAVQLGIEPKKESLLVTGESPLMQANNANLVTTFDYSHIAALPNPGGDITTYVFAVPGVTVNTGGTWGNFSVFGLPSVSNVFTVNGTDITDPYYNLNPSGATGLTRGVNEIEEAAVVVNGYLGQYGHLAGANVNYLTKYGTNSFHGNALWNYNGRALNANDWFNNANGVARPFAISNGWADSLGGPVVRNNLFFFVNNEGMRYVLPDDGRVGISTPAFSNYVLEGLAQNQPAAVALYQQALNLYAGAPGGASAVPLTKALDPHLGCGDFVNAVYGV